MKNLITLNVESVLGSVILVAFLGGIIGFFFIFLKNYNNDLDLLNASLANPNASSLSKIPSVERIQIIKWVKDNNIDLPRRQNQYHYLLSKYPDKPWLQ